MGYHFIVSSPITILQSTISSISTHRNFRVSILFSTARAESSSEFTVMITASSSGLSSSARTSIGATLALVIILIVASKVLISSRRSRKSKAAVTSLAEANGKPSTGAGLVPPTAEIGIQQNPADLEACSTLEHRNDGEQREQEEWSRNDFTDCQGLHELKR
jgi:hypothetical protein